MGVVVIGVDPHKASHTAVAVGEHEEVLGQLRATASARQRAGLLRWAARWHERKWAVDGALGLGRLLSQQLLAAGEQVVDVQPKLAARVRLLDAGAVNKNDPNDDRSVAIAALRSTTTRAVSADDDALVMKIWARRHKDLALANNQVANRLHAVLCELVPGGFAKKSLSCKQKRFSTRSLSTRARIRRGWNWRANCSRTCVASTSNDAPTGDASPRPSPPRARR